MPTRPSGAQGPGCHTHSSRCCRGPATRPRRRGALRSSRPGGGQAGDSGAGPASTARPVRPPAPLWPLCWLSLKEGEEGAGRGLQHRTPQGAAGSPPEGVPKGPECGSPRPCPPCPCPDRMPPARPGPRRRAPGPPTYLRLQTLDAPLLFPQAPKELGYDIHPVGGVGGQQAAEGQCTTRGAFPPPCTDAQALRVRLGVTEPLWAPEFRVLWPLGHGGGGGQGCSHPQAGPGVWV